MTRLRYLTAFAGVCLACAAGFASPALAQPDPDRLVAPPAQRERVVAPPMTFPSAEAHYDFLLKRAKGGTRHTLASLPDWSGIWQSGIATMSMAHPVDAPMSAQYRASYEEKRRQEREIGEVYYDRLTHCEPSAYPRWLVEPYHKEFALSPNQTWLMQSS